ncbi:histone deacetylase [bacterium]|nr:histone deacetylase [bacterium]
MKLYCTDRYPLPLPDGHRFPAEKYRLLRERVISFKQSDFELLEAPAATDEQILTAHSIEYLNRLKSGTLDRVDVRRLGLPWSQELLVRSRHSAGGTIAACQSAIIDGVSVCLAGGTHHAFREAPEGFCVFNDSIIAARQLQRDGLLLRVAVIDTDVHQGNGTAKMAEGDPSIFTFSIHGSRNFPFQKTSSDLDFALPDQTDDSGYLSALQQGVDRSLDLSRAQLVIFLAGADPFVGDRFSRWNVTKEGLSGRDEIVFDACYRRQIPVAVTMAGGYGKDIQDTVDIYAQTVMAAGKYWRRWKNDRQSESAKDSGNGNERD